MDTSTVALLEGVGRWPTAQVAFGALVATLLAPVTAKQLALLVAATARGIGQGLQGQQAPVGRESPLEEVQCLLALLGTSSMGTAVQAPARQG